MSAITIKFVTDHELTNEMSLEELSHKEQAFALIPSQRTGRTKSQVTSKEGEAEAEVNICCAKSACQISDIIPEGEIIRETAQRIMRDNLGKKEVKLIIKALAETSPNLVACTSSLKSVKERLDSYDVSNTPDKQALANVMIMLCIRPAEIKDLRISNGGVTGYQSSRQLEDLGTPETGILSKFLKKAEFLSETANTIASQALRHSPKNNTAPSQRVRGIPEGSSWDINVLLGLNWPDYYPDLVLGMPWFQENGATLDICNSKLLLG
ncbi:hypothetical protein C1646_775378 [Rhizophagus diaphanus]|nr:hypothetical protein C1646_775378 [Rhizophagus diaphanus] [Rhizophagus sp. MUCL 43196]